MPGRGAERGQLPTSCRGVCSECGRLTGATRALRRQQESHDRVSVMDTQLYRRSRDSSGAGRLMTTRVQLSRPVLEAELSAGERPSGSPSREYGGEVVITDGANAGRLSWVGVQEPHAEDWGTLVPRRRARGADRAGKGGGPGVGSQTAGSESPMTSRGQKRRASSRRAMK